jgi:hypothetical protein
MKWKWICSGAALIAGIAGCASSPQPFDYHDDRDEKPGPGLFSGEEGGFVIYGEPPAQAEDPGRNKGKRPDSAIEPLNPQPYPEPEPCVNTPSKTPCPTR